MALLQYLECVLPVGVGVRALAPLLRGEGLRLGKVERGVGPEAWFDTKRLDLTETSVELCVRTYLGRECWFGRAHVEICRGEHTRLVGWSVRQRRRAAVRARDLPRAVRDRIEPVALDSVLTARGELRVERTSAPVLSAAGRTVAVLTGIAVPGRPRLGRRIRIHYFTGSPSPTLLALRERVAARWSQSTERPRLQDVALGLDGVEYDPPEPNGGMLAARMIRWFLRDILDWLAFRETGVRGHEDPLELRRAYELLDGFGRVFHADLSPAVARDLRACTREAFARLRRAPSVHVSFPPGTERTPAEWRAISAAIRPPRGAERRELLTWLRSRVRIERLARVRSACTGEAERTGSESARSRLRRALRECTGDLARASGDPRGRMPNALLRRLLALRYVLQSCRGLAPLARPLLRDAGRVEARLAICDHNAAFVRRLSASAPATATVRAKALAYRAQALAEAREVWSRMRARAKRAR